jgi:predicted O-methyltransferase YrrM
MNLDSALTVIAADWGFDAAELVAYAAEDNIGGYPEVWPTGSLWSVEGKTLYALVRALKPAYVVEFGSWKGCSGSHLAAALRWNDWGRLVCVDPYPPDIDVFAPELRSRIEIVGAKAEDWLLDNDLADYGLCLEDGYHNRSMVAQVWTAARERMPVGGVVISHDALHATSQAEVEAGMSDAVGDAWRSYLIEPSDTGLGVYRKS